MDDKGTITAGLLVAIAIVILTFTATVVVLLLWLSLSWWTFLLIAGLLSLFELGLFRLDQQAATE